MPHSAKTAVKAVQHISLDHQESIGPEALKSRMHKTGSCKKEFAMFCGRARRYLEVAAEQEMIRSEVRKRVALKISRKKVP